MAYTKKDIQKPKGDTDVRKHVRLPKSTLGLCIPLALESNGTIFSALKLESEKVKGGNGSGSAPETGNAEKKGSTARKLATVFAKRFAMSAVPSVCQKCECSAPNTGTAVMECYPCYYPLPEYLDYGFSEDDPSEDEFDESNEE